MTARRLPAPVPVEAVTLGGKSAEESARIESTWANYPPVNPRLFE